PGAFLAAADGGAAGEVPPGGVLVVWALQHVGMTTPARVSAALTALGSLALPCVLVAVRSLCHEPAARRLAPVLSIAPFAVWTAGSVDALVLALTAAAIACGVIGSEPRRSAAWAAGAGFLLGLATLVSYVAWGLAAAVVITYFVRRRPLPNLVTGIAFLVPLFAAQLAGFIWSRGFGSARSQLHAATAARPGVIWLVLDVVAVVAVAGPTLVASARKIRRTPGWPFLVGASIGLAFAVATGLSRGDGERALLPFLPWLLVAAVAPERRPSSGDPPERTAAVFPAALTAVGAAVALLWQVLAAGN
ncbi:MAG: methylthioxylose transferase, partial [Frankiaceae bacterium]|nr:methylthioxylose transferase [Frankiaceae bacterium]